MILLTETHDRRDYFDTLQPLLLACSQRLADLSNSDADVFAAAVADLSKLATDLTGKCANDTLRQSAPASSAQTTANSDRQKTLKASHHRSDTEPVAAYFCDLAACTEVPAVMQVLFTLLSVTACGGDCSGEDAAAVSARVSAAVPSAQMEEPAANAIGDGFADLGVACKCRKSALGSLLSTTLRRGPASQRYVPPSRTVHKRNVFEQFPCQIPAQAGQQRPQAWVARIALHRHSVPDSCVNFTGIPAGVSICISPTQRTAQYSVHLSTTQARVVYCCMWPATAEHEGVRQRLLQSPLKRWESELQLAGISDTLVLACALQIRSRTHFSPQDFDYDYHLLLAVVA